MRFRGFSLPISHVFSPHKHATSINPRHVALGETCDLLAVHTTLVKQFVAHVSHVLCYVSLVSHVLFALQVFPFCISLPGWRPVMTVPLQQHVAGSVT